MSEYISRDDFKAELRRETVTLPNKKKVIVRELTIDEAETVADRHRKFERENPGADTFPPGLRSYVCACALIDRDGNRLYPEGEEKQFGMEVRKEVVEAIFPVVLRLSKMVAGQAEADLGNSEPSLSGDSSSS